MRGISFLLEKSVPPRVIARASRHPRSDLRSHSRTFSRRGRGESILRRPACGAARPERNARIGAAATRVQKRASRRPNVHGMPAGWTKLACPPCVFWTLYPRAGIERPLSGARSMYGAARGAEKRGYRCQIFRRRPPRTGSLYTERLRK